jgi:hypothetical protein
VEDPDKCTTSNFIAALKDRVSSRLTLHLERSGNLAPFQEIDDIFKHVPKPTSVHVHVKKFRQQQLQADD